MHAWNVLQSQFGGFVRPLLYSLTKEMNALTQGDMTVTEYHGKFIYTWSEEEALQEM